MMQALGSADLRGALDTLGAIAEGTVADGAFARHGLESLPRLVASELTTLSVCDLDGGHRSVVCDQPGAIGAREREVFDRHLHTHPLVRAHGHPRACTVRIGDAAPVQDFRRSALYNDYYRRIRIDHVMAVPIHVQPNVLVSFVLNRSRRDFSDRDRDCLEAIRPHLGNLYRLTRAKETSRAAWGVPAPDAPVADRRLTAREREVLQWLSGGKTDRDIAAILGISPRTIHKHLQRIYEKLGVETRTAAVTRALGYRAAAA